jgi:hypothetical protein
MKMNRRLGKITPRFAKATLRFVVLSFEDI